MGTFGLFILDTWLKNPLLVVWTFIIFIFLDIKLTRLAYSLSQQKYAHHYKSEIFELNPIHQEAIHNNKPIKRITWVLYGFMLIAFFLLSEFYLYGDPLPISEIILGLFFFLYFGIILNHSKNILVFRHVIHHPESINGEITVTPTFTYGSSKSAYWSSGLLWVFVFILTGNLFFLGGTFATLLIRFWIGRWDSKVTKKTKPVGKSMTESIQFYQCPTCGHELESNTKHCPFCGSTKRKRYIKRISEY